MARPGTRSYSCSKRTAYRQGDFAFDDGGMRNEVHWVDLARFRTGEEQLFPHGLLEQMK
jgi:hypothetical protein